MLLAVSATFATEDVDLVSADVDETILEEVVAVEDDSATLSEVSDDSEVQAQDSSDDLKEGGESSNTVTNATFFDYFDESGTLKDSVTSDELIFEGTFENLPGVNYLTIDKSIKLTGKDAVLKNINILVSADNVEITSFTINTDATTNAITVGNVNDVNITKNIINFKAIEDDDSACAIYAESVKNLNIVSNVVTFVGNKSGNKVINLVDSDNAVIDDNTINAILPSVTYGSHGALNFDYDSDNLKFINNNITVQSICMVPVPDWDNYIYGSTMIVVYFAGNNITVAGNKITGSGDYYTYGIAAYGSDFNVNNNNVTISSDIHYSCGIDVEGSENGVVDNNIFIVDAIDNAYGIYSGMTSGGIAVNYTKNTINAKSYFAVGIEIGATNEKVIGNDITVNGNYTIGIGALECIYYAPPAYTPVSLPVSRYIQDNTISSIATNVGSVYSGDMIPAVTTGIYTLAGNVTIENNKINTNGDNAVITYGDNITVSNNNLVAAKSVGDKSVIANGDANVFDNTPALKIILFATDLTKTEGDSAQFTVAALDENGEALANKTITITINSKAQNATTNDKGIASFNIDLAAGTYTVESAFAGDDTYGPKSITNSITVNAKPIAPATPKVTKKATKITASKKTFKAKTKTKKYTIILKSGKTPIKSVKVYLKIGKKTFKATTNKNGKATFKITKLTKKGKYTAKITYKGSSTYKASSKSVKITVKK